MDAQAQGLLGTLARQGVRDFSEMSLAEARDFMNAFIPLQGPAEDVADVSDLTVAGSDGTGVPVRIYRPQSSKPRPVIVYCHGGGFALGTLAVADKPSRQLANATGCTVVSVDYRLAPEHKAPSAAEDAYAVVKWSADHAKDFGSDGTRLIVAGDSAGGNLAAVACLMARDRGGPRIALQMLLYPIVDLGFDRHYPSRVENADGRLLTVRALKWFYAHCLAAPGDAEKAYISPLRAADLAGLPDAIVLTAGFDPLRDEGEAYAARLREHGAHVTLLQNPGMIHGFLWMSGVIDHAKRVYAELGALARTRTGLDQKNS